MENTIRLEPISQMIASNGKTIRENNLIIPHNVPIGTLVEVKYDDWYGDGACQKVHARLWVVQHQRDCDGTPLYGLSRWSIPHLAEEFSDIVCGLGEEQLTPIELTETVKSGEDVLEWEDQ
jgi:hypothetical protein